jgi:hypothetical protein
VTRTGSCPCGTVRYTISGPVRDVIVCHCDACREAGDGGPWAASAARRENFAVEDLSSLVWRQATVSEHGASRAWCRACGTYVLWDAPGRDTVSFAAATLDDSADLAVAAHIWVPEGDVVPAAREVSWRL